MGKIPELKNYMELAVKETVEKVLVLHDDVCKCAQCKMDIMAIILNRLPARYIVTNKGRILTKIKETETQFQADILREVVRAFTIIKKKPRHDKTENNF